MGNFRKSYTARFLTAALIASMVFGSIESDLAMPVWATETSEDRKVSDEQPAEEAAPGGGQEDASSGSDDTSDGADASEQNSQSDDSSADSSQSGSGQESGDNSGTTGSGQESGDSSGTAGGGQESGNSSGATGSGQESGDNSGTTGSGQESGDSSGTAGGGQESGDNSGTAGGQPDSDQGSEGGTEEDKDISGNDMDGSDITGGTEGGQDQDTSGNADSDMDVSGNEGPDQNISGNEIPDTDVSGNDVPDISGNEGPAEIFAEAGGVKLYVRGLEEAFPDIADFEKFSVKLQKIQDTEAAGAAILQEEEDAEVRELQLYDAELYYDGDKAVPERDLELVFEGLGLASADDEWVQGYYIEETEKDTDGGAADPAEGEAAEQAAGPAAEAERVSTQADAANDQVILTVSHFSKYAIALLGKAPVKEMELTVQTDGLTFTLTGKEDAFPKTAEKLQLVAEKLADDEAAAGKIREQLDQESVLEHLDSYQLKLTAGGEEVFLTKDAQVRLTIEGLEADTTEDEGKEETAQQSVSDNDAAVEEEEKFPVQITLYDLNEESPAQLAMVTEDSKLETELSGLGIFGLAYLSRGREVVLTTTVNDVEITLTAPADAFPQTEGLYLHAEEITDDRLEQAREQIEKDILPGGRAFVSYRLFDIAPYLDDAELQPERPVQVSFKNLLLEQEDGSEIDLAAKLQEGEKKPETAMRMMRSSLAAEQEKEENSYGVYHFTDPETVEEVAVEVQQDAVVMETDHFSWYFAGENAKTGDPYTWNYEDEGGEYTLDYILRHYNVFISGDYKGTHVVGPMVVGGTTTLNGSLGGTTQGTGKYVHTAPSYLEGKAENRDFPNFPRVITERSDLPIYVGFSTQARTSGKIQYAPYYYTPEEVYKAGFTSYGTEDIADSSKLYVDFDKVFPNEWPNAGGNGGILYGDKDEKGSIEFYRNFEGYDINGNKVEKVSITSKLIETAKNNPNKIYFFNKDGKEVTPDKGADGKELKNQYVFAINTEGQTGKVNIRLRPGYNYTFDSFADVFSVVYDYVDAEEMSGTLTIIQTEQGGEVVIPRIYKSIPNDEFGINYGFSSIEKGPAFSVMWFAPNAQKVYVGFENANSTKDDTNGSKLVGHLVVPQADVTLGGGDFNGGVIAHDVDAVTVGSEGHMWPFLVGAGLPGVEILGTKKVDGHTPMPDEKFQFRATLLKKDDQGEGEYTKDFKFNSNDENGASYENPWIQENDNIGEFKFYYKNGSLYQGDYRVVIEELDLAEQAETYKKDPSVYVGEFHIEEKADNENPPPVKVTWKKYADKVAYEKGEGGEVYTAPTLQFNNTSKKKLTVKKEWYDEDGSVIEGSNADLPNSITVDLYRTSTPPDGHRVTLELYSGAHPTDSECRLLDTQVLGYVNDDVNIKLEMKCNKLYPLHEKYKLTVARIRSVKKRSVVEGKSTELDITKTDCDTWLKYPAGFIADIGTIREDVVIEVYYQDYTSEMPASAADFTISTEGTNWNIPTFDPLENYLYQSDIVLNQQNNWSYTWDDLAPRGMNGNPYYYLIQESTGSEEWQVAYDGNNVRLHKTDNATITVKNTKLPSKADLQLTKKDEKSKAVLKGAQFVLSKQDGSSVSFQKTSDGAYQYVETSIDGKTTTVLITDDNGIWKITDLPYGSYTLQETKAPNGYIEETRKVQIILSKDSSIWKYQGELEEHIFEKNEDGANTLYFFDFTNKAGLRLPDTGGLGTDMFAIGGISFVGVSLLILFYELVRRRKEAELKGNRL